MCALDFERKHHVDDPTVHDTSHYVWVTDLAKSGSLTLKEVRQSFWVANSRVIKG